MKYISFTLLIIYAIVLNSSPIQSIHATENKNTTIKSFEEDITGDGFHEQILMEGNLLSDQSPFYQNIWLDIQNPFQKKWSISLQAGYHPNLQFIDLNHDRVMDLFYQVQKENSSQKYNYQIYTLNSGKVSSIPLPVRYFAEGEYIDDFKVNIHLDPHQSPNTIDISDKKQEYIKQNIYNEHGKIQKQTAIYIEAISKLEPILISKSKGYGLKSIQIIKGINENDTIGKLETLWHFKKDKWTIVQSKIHSP